MKGVIIMKNNPVLVLTGWLTFLIGLIVNPNIVFLKVFLLTVARVLPFGLKTF